MDRAAIVAVLRELLLEVPAGCSWLAPVRAEDGRVVDFRVEAVGGEVRDIFGRGVERIGGLVSELYPRIVDWPLWQLYLKVQATGVPGTLVDARYEHNRPGVVASSQFEVTARRVFGGLLVWWERVDEARRRLDCTEHLGNLGWAEYDLVSGAIDWSAGMYRVLERDPALGPMSRAQQVSMLVPDDRGVAETGWQLLDSGAVSDVTVRVRLGATVKHLRILSDVAHDGGGQPLKIYTVVQDVTAREESKSAIDQLRDRLLRREMTALAEHRLAAQVQNMIQPVPSQPFPLAGLDAIVVYLPAEATANVGGDWYCAQNLPDGHVALAIGDVAGHGLQAANGMAHLRFALIAWLSIGIQDPGLLLHHMNRLSTQLGITGTAMIAIYDPVEQALSWARAGHPPPLLGRASTVLELAQPAGILLGVDPDTAHPVVTSRLWDNDLVVLYTDGLVERRPGSADQPLDQIKQTLTEISATPQGPALTRLRDLLPQPSPDDDTCMLAIQVRATLAR